MNLNIYNYIYTTIKYLNYTSFVSFKNLPNAIPMQSTVFLFSTMAQTQWMIAHIHLYVEILGDIRRLSVFSVLTKMKNPSCQ